MADLTSLFVTRLYRAALSEHGPSVDLGELAATCLSVAEDDAAGQDWCEANGYAGYTSYASLADLPRRMPVFADLARALDGHVAAFADDLALDLDGGRLVLEDIWINVLPEGGFHGGHIHPHSVVSGTVYVAMPEGTSALKLEDPRLPMMMAAPVRRADAAEGLRTHVSVAPRVGDVLLWESFVRHEVPMNMAEAERVSVSFNYKWT